MSLRVAVQMDPLENINIAGDSSFALMLSAQARGFEVWHYDVATLAYESDGTPHGRITAHAAPVTVQRVEGDHFHAGDRRRIDLARDIDVVLMRQDPPFHLGYISSALLLDRLKGTTLVANDPREVVNAPEKMFVLDYAQYMPPTLVARHLDDLENDVRGIIQPFVDVVKDADIFSFTNHENHRHDDRTMVEAARLAGVPHILCEPCLLYTSPSPRDA